jgi:hypothetical protein
LSQKSGKRWGRVRAGQRRRRRRRRWRATAGTAASGSIGSNIAFVGEVPAGVEELPDGGGFPRLLELGAFFCFVEEEEADVFPVVCEVDDFPVVVVDADDLPVVAVVDDRRVVVVVEEAGLAEGPVVVVEEAADAWAWVIWMLRWPSLESELPSLATKLNASTSTPAGAW